MSDIERSTAFYKTIFKADSVFSSPRYVAFAADSKAAFAIWTGGVKLDRSIPRFSEIGIMLSTDEAVENFFEEWKKNPDIKITKELFTEVLGRTFLVEDPDDHINRVCRFD